MKNYLLVIFLSLLSAGTILASFHAELANEFAIKQLQATTEALRYSTQYELAKMELEKLKLQNVAIILHGKNMRNPKT